MPVLKQKTVDGDTYRLKRRKSSRSGQDTEFTIEVDGKQVGDPMFRRQSAMDEFEGTVSAVKRATTENRRDKIGTPVDDDIDQMLGGSEDFAELNDVGGGDIDSAVDDVSNIEDEFDDYFN